MDLRISFTSALYRVDRRQIGFLRFVIEACDGLAVMTTLEPHSGLVRITVAAGREVEAERLLADLVAKEGLRIERQDGHPNDGSL